MSGIKTIRTTIPQRRHQPHRSRGKDRGGIRLSDPCVCLHTETLPTSATATHNRQYVQFRSGSANMCRYVRVPGPFVLGDGDL